MASTLFVGVDWAKAKHDVCIMSEGSDRPLDAFTIEHGPSGFAELHRRIDAHREGVSEIAVAIERPHGSLVASCLLRGYVVFTLNPLQADRFRDRYFASGAKDDRRDALVLASAMRTDRPCFRMVIAPSEHRCMLAELVKIHDELTEQKVALMNRLGALLHEYYPQFEKACDGDYESAWVWDAWRIVPTHEIAKSAIDDELAKLFARRRVRRTSAADFLTVLREEQVPVMAGVERAFSKHVSVIVDQLEVVEKHLRQLGKDLEEQLEVLAQHDPHYPDRGPTDVDIIRSLPGAGAYVTAALISEAGDELANLDYERLRAVSGVAPITQRSGGKKFVKMRRACRTILRHAIHHLARVAMKQDQKIHERYRALRARGIQHPAALRVVGDGMLRALVSMLKNRTLWRETARTRSTEATAS